MAITPLNGPRPLTWTGVVLEVNVPSPSWPELLVPQAKTEPSDLRARLWLSPAAVAMTPLPFPRPTTEPGSNPVVGFEKPSWPEPLLPHTIGIVEPVLTVKPVNGADVPAPVVTVKARVPVAAPGAILTIT